MVFLKLTHDSIGLPPQRKRCWVTGNTVGNPTKDKSMSQNPKKLAIITSVPETPKSPSKKSQMISLLGRPEGVSLTELEKATGWQTHSLRGALVHLKNKDKLPVTSTMVDGVRRYQIIRTEA